MSHANPSKTAAAVAATPPATVLLGEDAIARSLKRIAHELLERNSEAAHLYLVAIPNGGIPLAHRLARDLKGLSEVEVPVGILDTTLYRDDLMVSGERPPLRRTEMPSAVDGRTVVLVDDVVNTGRTIRAAMDALMDFGRPRAVQLVGLVDRGHRELPIRPDFVGKNVPTRRDERVVLQSEGAPGSERLEVVLYGATGDVS